MGDGFLGYAGKSVLVVGGATGMGAAAAVRVRNEGARVTVMDVAELDYEADAFIRVDLRDRASVDGAVEQLAGPVHSLFSCAGVADGTAGLALINFIAQRHLLERLVEGGQLASGAAAVMVSSVAGLSWPNNLAQVNEFLDTSDWDAAAAWIADHPGTEGYVFSKQAMSAYVAGQGYALLRQGLRINAIQPGPTDTPLARANADVWLAFGQDYRDAASVPHLTAEEMANVLLFLGSPASSGINGTNLLVDQGQIGAGATDAFPSPTVKAMLGLAQA